LLQQSDSVLYDVAAVYVSEGSGKGAFNCLGMQDRWRRSLSIQKKTTLPTILTAIYAYFMITR
jgi:hypothetical protein